ncbi:hypothetical protein [Bacillus sp. V5-8f]|uniref:hypothetical protein n=1 Tax=Bacillus sp. V5-8f TaxID=2053044 RepID=UPI000C774C4E|nr:hypothetical protein [Bacillus sp. V5-8f]PLT34834.1 hypothetical protein CUU64_05365 [Bacillus sp. V5-8f]
MKKSQWNKEDIEELLKKLPEIKDKRNPNEMFQSVMLKTGKQKKRNWIPIIAAVSALFLLAVLASTQMTGHNQTATENAKIEKKAESGESQSGKGASIHSQDPSRSDAFEEDKRTGKNEKEASVADEQEETSRDNSAIEVKRKGAVLLSSYSVIASNAKSDSVITVGVPDKQANYVVPVTYIADEDVPGGKQDQLLKAMSVVDEESLGLAEYFPLNVKMTPESEGRTVNIDIPAGSKLLLEDMLFFSVMQETFKYQDIEKLTFSSEGTPGVEFSHMGPLQELKINHTDNKAYLFYQLDDSAPKLLVPSINAYQSMEEAMVAMKNGTGDQTILPSIPMGFTWNSVEKRGSNVIIEVNDGTDLKDNDEYLRALEAILFTAKNFGYQNVEFRNAKLESIGPYHLKEPVPVLVAPNRMN